MKLVKECTALVMSPDDRSNLSDHLGVIWGHLEDHFRSIGDVESGTDAARLMDAMSALETLHRMLNAGEYA